MVLISGKLIDEASLAGIEQTPLYLNGKIAAVSNEDGNYTLDVIPGDYKLEIRPREFLYVLRDVRVTPDGRILDIKTGRPLKKDMPMVRATL